MPARRKGAKAGPEPNIHTSRLPLVDSASHAPIGQVAVQSIACSLYDARRSAPAVAPRLDGGCHAFAPLGHELTHHSLHPSPACRHRRSSYSPCHHHSHSHSSPVPSLSAVCAGHADTLDTHFSNSCHAHSQTRAVACQSDRYYSVAFTYQKAFSACLSICPTIVPPLSHHCPTIVPPLSHHLHFICE